MAILILHLLKNCLLEVLHFAIAKIANHPRMAGTVLELTSGVPCPRLGCFCPGSY